MRRRAFHRREATMHTIAPVKPADAMRVLQAFRRCGSPGLLGVTA